MTKPIIYADHAATTALSPRAFEAMRPFLSDEYANPSTLYRAARIPRRAVASARERIAAALGASPEEIRFTSCGTEADNWALKGVAFRHPGRGRRIIVSAIEHHAVLNTCAFLGRMGYEIVRLPVDAKGLVAPGVLESALTEDTVLVSVMYANNEIGTIEPVGELAAVARRRGVPFHTDAVQAVGHIPVNVRELGVDMLSASAHKFNGPKGAGFLYVREGFEIEPLLHGGGQEFGSRAGTENVAGIVGMAEALSEHVETLERDARKLETLRACLLARLEASGVRFLVNGAERRIPGSLSLSFYGADGEAILHRLDLMGIAVATGSACNSRETVLSHVLQAIGVPAGYARGSVRITLGIGNDEAQVLRIADCLVKIVSA